MLRIAVGGMLHPSGLKILEANPEFQIDYTDANTLEPLIPMIYEADAILLRTQPLPGDLIAKCKNLKMVSRHGVGYDAVDMTALNRRRIPLAIIGDVNSYPVAEHAMMLLLAVSKQLLKYDGATRSGDWEYRNSLDARSLRGKSLLIIGYGRIGRHLSRMAKAFGMSIIIHDPFLTETDITSEDVKLAPDFSSALSHADAISIHVPKTEKPVLGPDEIATLKSSAIIINTSRGGVVDEVALADALASGKIRGAGIDVFSTEPHLADHPLSKLDQVILTPHVSGMTLECAEQMSISSVQNVIDFFNVKLDPTLVPNRQEIGFS